MISLTYLITKSHLCGYISGDVCRLITIIMVNCRKKNEEANKYTANFLAVLVLRIIIIIIL